MRPSGASTEPSAYLFGMGRAGTIGVLIAVLLAAAPAGALAQGGGEAPTRPEYVAEADRICEVPYRKSIRTFAKADALKRDGDYVRGGKKTIRSGKYALEANERLEELVRPSADARLLGVWIDMNHDSFDQLVKAGKALKAKKPGKWETLVDRSRHTARRANKKVVGFGFNHCA